MNKKSCDSHWEVSDTECLVGVSIIDGLVAKIKDPGRAFERNCIDVSLRGID
jgi:hypothetical protein